MGVVIAGVVEEVPGLTVESWFDSMAFRLPGIDRGARSTKWVRSIGLHTTLGIPSVPGRGGWENAAQTLLDGPSPLDAADTVSNWTHGDRVGGAHLVVGGGRIICTADLLAEKAYHAQSINDVSIGIEMRQQRDGAVYASDIAMLVKLVDWLTARFGIQRQLPFPYRNWKPAQRLHAGGLDFVGIFGHRDQTDGRGPGDPGDFVIEAFMRAGYEGFDLGSCADLVVWKQRQAQLNATGADLTVDGVPGPATVKALLAAGHANGLWVPRPTDELQ